jgi:hypothetical protein
MTPQEQFNTLHALDQILRDNAGNRITLALIVGIVSALREHMPVVAPTPAAEPPAGPAWLPMKA